MPRARVLDWLMLAVLVAVWGSAFAALKTAVGVWPPVWVVTGRLWVGALTLALVMGLWRQRTPALLPRPHASWWWYAGVGVIGTAAPFLMFAFASTRLPSAVVAIVSGATPVFTAMLAHLFIGAERLNRFKSIGVALGFAGIVTLVGPGALASLAPESGAAASAATFALGAALVGAVGYGVGAVMTRSAPKIAATTGAFMFCLCGAVAVLPLALVGEGLPAWPGWKVAAAVLFLGIGPTGLASAGWVWLVQRRGALFGSMATYLSPVWATLLGVAVLGERPGWTAYAALGMILAGVAVASRTPTAPEPPAADSPAP